MASDGEDIGLAPIAQPLANKKLSKKIHKLVRKGSALASSGRENEISIYGGKVEIHAAESKCLRRGVKEVVKSIRRGHKGLCIIAGNISPIDVITHVPILCEESDIPYIYVMSKEELATAGATKRPTCCVLVMTKPAKGELEQEVQEKLQSEYEQVVSEVKLLASSLY